VASLQAVGLAGLVVACVTDLKARIIPNTVVLWVLGVGGAARVAEHGIGAWPSLALVPLVFLPLAWLARRDLLGGGDAKLIPATTLLVEPAQAPTLIVSIMLAGGVLAAAWYVMTALGRRASQPLPEALPPPPGSGPASSTGPPSRIGQADMPYALAILAGAASTVLGFA
jgi:prepilin peptidase CpaA